MKKVYRRMMLFSTTVIFLAVAPLVALYAMGYRVGTSSVDPLPVGGVYIESVPRQAQVQVDGAAAGKTPRLVSNLLPGTVTVAVRQDGYDEWKKQIAIQPGLVAEVNAVRLFPTKHTSNTLLGQAALFALAPNRQLLAVVTTDQHLHIIDTDGTAIITPVALRFPPQTVLWSPDNTHVLLTYRNRAGAVVTVATAHPVPAVIPALAGARRAQWDERIPGRLFILTRDRTLLAYSVINQASSVIDTNVQMFRANSRQIVASMSSGALRTYTLQGERETELTALTEKPVQQLLVSGTGNIALRTSDQTLFMLNKDSTLTQVATAVITAEWSLDGQLLLVQPQPNELYVYNVGLEHVDWLPLNELHLVTRLSRPLTQAQWFAGNRHLIYQVGDEITISEIDTRDHAVTYTVDSTNTSSAAAAVGRDGTVLFYLKHNGTGNNLVAARLEVE